MKISTRRFHIEIAIICSLVGVAAYPKEYSTYSNKAHKIVKSIPLAGAEFIISDALAVGTDYTFDDVVEFMGSFDHPFELSELAMIYNACQYSGIHFLYFATKIQMESSLITNPDKLEGRLLRYRKRWVLGYDMYRTLPGGAKPSGGLSSQVYGAAACLRKHIDEYCPGKTVSINLGRDKIRPANAATYALYRYTPFWGKTKENGAVCSGNEIFRPTYKYFLKYWKKA